MGGSLAVKSVETLRGDEPPRLRLISANLACEPYACLADEGPYRRHRAVDRQRVGVAQCSPASTSSS